jgi:hypothetical protein
MEGWLERFAEMGLAEVAASTGEWGVQSRAAAS